VATWIVWRQEGDGNRFEVARFAVRTDALATTMEARGHKQTYWVAASSSCVRRRIVVIGSAERGS
jgi:hypothetical protein